MARPAESGSKCFAFTKSLSSSSLSVYKCEQAPSQLSACSKKKQELHKKFRWKLSQQETHTCLLHSSYSFAVSFCFSIYYAGTLRPDSSFSKDSLYTSALRWSANWWASVYIGRFCVTHMAASALYSQGRIGKRASTWEKCWVRLNIAFQCISGTCIATLFAGMAVCSKTVISVVLRKHHGSSAGHIVKIRSTQALSNRFCNNPCRI